MTLLDDDPRATAAALTRDLTPEQRRALADQLTAAALRLEHRAAHPTALDLARRYDPGTVVTPALAVVNTATHRATTMPGGRLVISVPPQEMKTTHIRWVVFRVLRDNPDLRVVYASYESGLARDSGRTVRDYLNTYGHHIGLAVSRDHADASNWTLAGHRGGMACVGVGGALTGRAADVLIIDDPLRDQAAADSDVIRGGVHDWYTSTARTRVAPNGAILVIQTRWHEDDLAGRRIAEGWPTINIPALSAADPATGQLIPDALGRPPGQWMESTRGRTPQQWAELRADVGERVFWALFQGQPKPLAGGVFQAQWFSNWRVTEVPAGLGDVTVYVDPADNEGGGDEAGIVVAGKVPGGAAYMIADLSAAMTAAAWVRRALLACVEYQAVGLAYERSLAGLRKRVTEGWATIWQQAHALARCGGDVDTAVWQVLPVDPPTDLVDATRLELLQLLPLLDGIHRFTEAGPAVRVLQPTGSKRDRAKLAAPMFETGKARMVGRWAVAEHQMTTWQEGQDSPDRMDAIVYAALDLGGAGATTFGAPAGAAAAQRATRGVQNVARRSTRSPGRRT